MLRPRLTSLRHIQFIQNQKLICPRRRIHTVIPLPFETLDPAKKGIYPVYSPEGFRIAWTERQTALIEQVNRIVQGTAVAHETLFDLVILSARQPDMASLFNAASAAWNNAFFFTGLLPQYQGVVEPTIPDSLRDRIDKDFGSLQNLRSLIFHTALAMHGSGWVWLVVGPSSELKVLATYNAGTPFDFSQRQTQDPNTAWKLDYPGVVTGYRPNRKDEYLILPLLGLNCWEHAYLPDYGVSNAGKEQYLKNWWASVNWQRVWGAWGRRQMKEYESR